MAEIRVQIQEIVKLVLDRESDRGQDRRPQTELAGAMDHVNVGKRRSKLIGDLPGAVGRVVVDDQDRALRRELADRFDQGLQVTCFVVSRQRNEQPAAVFGDGL